MVVDGDRRIASEKEYGGKREKRKINKNKKKEKIEKIERTEKGRSGYREGKNNQYPEGFSACLPLTNLLICKASPMSQKGKAKFCLDVSNSGRENNKRGYCYCLIRWSPTLAPNTGTCELGTIFFFFFF